MSRRLNFDEDGPLWVIGVIDSHGDIRARTADWRSGATHTDAERLAGRPWRWNIADQEFHAVRENSGSYDPNDTVLIVDWLERNGYKDECEELVTR